MSCPAMEKKKTPPSPVQYTLVIFKKREEEEEGRNICWLLKRTPAQL